MRCTIVQKGGGGVMDRIGMKTEKGKKAERQK